MDIMPTLLEAAGVAVPEGVDARSLTVLGGPTPLCLPGYERERFE